VDIDDGACAREPGVHVDDRRSPLLRLHHPSKTDGVALGHVRAFNNDAIRVLKILLERAGAAPSEGGPQTGDRGGVSYTGLIFDLQNPK
jgi:hypothetical protein